MLVQKLQTIYKELEQKQKLSKEVKNSIDQKYQNSIRSACIINNIIPGKKPFPPDAKKPTPVQSLFTRKDQIQNLIDMLQSLNLEGYEPAQLENQENTQQEQKELQSEELLKPLTRFGIQHLQSIWVEALDNNVYAVEKPKKGNLKFLEKVKYYESPYQNSSTKELNVCYSQPNSYRVNIIGRKKRRVYLKMLSNLQDFQLEGATLKNLADFQKYQFFVLDIPSMYSTFNQTPLQKIKFFTENTQLRLLNEGEVNQLYQLNFVKNTKLKITLPQLFKFEDESITLGYALRKQQANQGSALVMKNTLIQLDLTSQHFEERQFKICQFMGCMSTKSKDKVIPPKFSSGPSGNTGLNVKPSKGREKKLQKEMQLQQKKTEQVSELPFCLYHKYLYFFLDKDEKEEYNQDLDQYSQLADVLLDEDWNWRDWKEALMEGQSRGLVKEMAHDNLQKVIKVLGFLTSQNPNYKLGRKLFSQNSDIFKIPKQYVLQDDMLWDILQSKIKNVIEHMKKAKNVEVMLTEQIRQLNFSSFKGEKLKNFKTELISILENNTLEAKLKKIKTFKTDVEAQDPNIKKSDTPKKSQAKPWRDAEALKARWVHSKSQSATPSQEGGQENANPEGKNPEEEEKEKQQQQNMNNSFNSLNTKESQNEQYSPEQSPNKSNLLQVPSQKSQKAPQSNSKMLSPVKSSLNKSFRAVKK